MKHLLSLQKEKITEWKSKRLAISRKGEPKLNVIFTPKGLERVSILGGVDLTLEAMELYRTIAHDVIAIDEKLMKKYEDEHETPRKRKDN
jgi:hypothetical protein